MYSGASRPDETGLRPVGILKGTGLRPALHRPSAGAGSTGLWPVGIYAGALRPIKTGLRPVGLLTGTGLRRRGYGLRFRRAQKKVAHETHSTYKDVVCNFWLDRFSIFRVISFKSFCEKRKRSMIAKIFDVRDKTRCVRHFLDQHAYCM